MKKKVLAGRKKWIWILDRDHQDFDKFGALGKNVNKSKQLVHFPNEDKIGRRKKIEYCACYPYTHSHTL